MIVMLCFECRIYSKASIRKLDNEDTLMDWYRHFNKIHHKKYHTLEQSQNPTRKKSNIDTRNIYIHDHPPSSLGTGTSIKRNGVNKRRRYLYQYVRQVSDIIFIMNTHIQNTNSLKVFWSKKAIQDLILITPVVSSNYLFTYVIGFSNINMQQHFRFVLACIP